MSACQHLITVLKHVWCSISSKHMFACPFFVSWSSWLGLMLSVLKRLYLLTDTSHSLFSAGFLKMSNVLQPAEGRSLFNYRYFNHRCVLCPLQLNTALFFSTIKCINQHTWKTFTSFCVKKKPLNILCLLFYFLQVVLVFALSIGALGIYFIDSSE